jgi:hypothetical protein
MVLAYTNGPRASAAELEVIRELERDGQTVRYRNAQFWKGEIERCDVVVTSMEKVSEAYKLRGTRVELVTGYVAPPKAKPRVTHERKAGGWWSIRVNGEEVKSVRQSGLTRALEEIRGSLVQA